MFLFKCSYCFIAVCRGFCVGNTAFEVVSRHFDAFFSYLKSACFAQFLRDLRIKIFSFKGNNFLPEL